MMPKCMVMAAGLGLRMRPLSDLPKPLVPVGGKALIDRTLDWLLASGITDVVINTHYRANLIREHLLNRRSPKINFSHEELLLETGGGIRKALPLLGEGVFFAVNSDVICVDGPAMPAIKRLLAAWDDGLDALLLLHPVEKATGYSGKGDFFLDNGGWLKRREADERAPYVFCGVQMLHPRIFEDTPDTPFSLNMLYDRAMQAENTPRIRGLVHDGAWLHVGDPAGVTAAETFLASVKS